MKKSLFKYILVLLFLVGQCFNIRAGIPIDTLKKNYRIEKDEAKRAVIIYKILTYYANNYDTAYYYFNIFLKNSIQAKEKFIEAYTYHSFGAACVENSHYEEAKKYLNEGIVRYKELGNDSMIAKAKVRIAFVYYTQSDFEAAIKTYLEAIQIAQKSNQPVTEAWAYNLLGLAFYAKPNPDYKTALDYYMKALNLYKKLKRVPSYGMVTLRIGATYTRLNDNINAKLYLERAMFLGDSLDDIQTTKWTLNEFSNYYRAQKDYFKSNEIEKRSKALSLRAEEYPGIIISYRHIADNNYNLNLYKPALESADSSIYYSLKYKILEALPEMYELKSSILDKLDQPREALVFYKKAMDLKDSLFSVQSSNNINELQTRFNTKEKEKAIELLNVEKESDRKIKNVLTLVIILAISMIGLIIFVLIKINAARKQFKQQKIEIEKQKQIVDEKQKEILDSIHYAKRIQLSLMPTEKYFEKNLKKGSDKN